MKLAEYQRAFMRASLAREVTDEELFALGDRDRVRMYRRMVRSRIEAMAQKAFRRTFEAVGPLRFAESFARFLDEAGPKSPYLRDVVADFGAYARSDEALLQGGPAYARDLLTFEHAKWSLAYRAAAMPRVGEGGVREFDFEGVPVLNPVLARLVLDYTVHRDAVHDQRTLLFVYRPPSLDQVRWYASEPFFFAVIERASERQQPFVTSVREAAEQSGRELHQELVAMLSESVVTALERGVLIGSRAPA